MDAESFTKKVYIAIEALAITRRVELIYKREFANITLNKIIKTFLTKNIRQNKYHYVQEIMHKEQFYIQK